jgi:hypothetical protein
MPSTESNSPPGLGPPGPNPLFFGVLGGLVLGNLAGLWVGDGEPAAALHSNFVFRIEVGVIVALVAYVGAAALWLAWHRSLFQRLTLGGAGLETPEQKDDLAARDARIELFMEETTDTLLRLSERVGDLEEAATSENNGSSR